MSIFNKIGNILGAPIKGLGQLGKQAKYNITGHYMAGGDVDRGGVIDAAQSVINQQSPYGGWIGRDESKMYTADFIDNDGDGIDDRWQTGPGMPSQNPFQGNKMADAWNQSFQVAQPLNTGISSALINTGNPFNIPIGGGPRPDLSGFYQGLGSFV